MRAVICSKPVDDLSTTTLTEAPRPDPQPGEVRVRMRAASLNPVDWKLCAGVAPWWTQPHVAGLDGAGEIDAVGDGITGWNIGDRVVWHGDLNRQGVFAEYAITVAHVLSRIPDGVSFEAAAALPCAGLTAYQALVRKIGLQTGQVIVIQGASGGVGGFAVQIAKNLGARVIALARPDKAARAEVLGADVVLDYRSEALAEEVRQHNGGEGADAMLEVVNPGDARRSLDLLRYNGQLATIAPLPDLSQTPAYTYGASLHEVALGGAYAAGDLRTQQDFSLMGDQLLKWLAKGKLDPMIEMRTTLQEVPETLAQLRRRKFDGKAVVTI